MRKMILLLAFCLPVCLPALADDLTKIQVHVTTASGKPVDRATVIVRFIKGRSLKSLGLKKIQTSWEMKTSQEGMAKIPSLPKGQIQIQIIAKNYQTFGETFDIQDDEKQVDIALKPPQKQYSSHEK